MRFLRCIAREKKYVKLLVVGDSGLGKTTLIRSLVSTPGDKLQVGLAHAAWATVDFLIHFHQLLVSQRLFIRPPAFPLDRCTTAAPPPTTSSSKTPIRSARPSRGGECQILPFHTSTPPHPLSLNQRNEPPSRQGTRTTRRFGSTRSRIRQDLETDWTSTPPSTWSCR